MTPSAIELTPEEAIHLHLAMVGEATDPTDHIFTERVATITEGQLKHKPVPKTTVSILHSNSTFIFYVQIILPSLLCNNLIFYQRIAATKGLGFGAAITCNA